MIQQETLVTITDNTWAKLWLVFGIIKWNSKTAAIWDTCVIAIKQAASTSSIKKWDVVRWVIVRTKVRTRRKDWTYISFDDNAVALVDKAWVPLWKRIFWPVAKELREKWHRAVAMLAEEII